MAQGGIVGNQALTKESLTAFLIASRSWPAHNDPVAPVSETREAITSYQPASFIGKDPTQAEIGRAMAEAMAKARRNSKIMITARILREMASGKGIDIGGTKFEESDRISADRQQMAQAISQAFKPGRV